MRHMIVQVYDPMDRKTFEFALASLQELRRYQSPRKPKIAVLLLGCRLDGAVEHRRAQLAWVALVQCMTRRLKSVLLTPRSVVRTAGHRAFAGGSAGGVESDAAIGPANVCECV